MTLSSSIFRIARPAKSRTTLAGREHILSGKSHDDVLLRVSKLIPAEVVGVYLTGRQIAIENDAIGSWAIICLLLVFLVRTATTKEPGKPWSFSTVQWDAILYAGVSFCVWVYAMGDNLAGFTLSENQFWTSLLAIVWPVAASQLVLLVHIK